MYGSPGQRVSAGRNTQGSQEEDYPQVRAGALARSCTTERAVSVSLGMTSALAFLSFQVLYVVILMLMLF